MIFTSLAFGQIGQALASRSRSESLLALGFSSNPLLTAMVLVVATLQLVVVYTAPLQAFFETTPLSMSDLAICLTVGAVIFIAMELEKRFFTPKSR